MSIVINSDMIKHVKGCTLRIIRKEIQTTTTKKKCFWRLKEGGRSSCKNFCGYKLSILIL